MTFKNRALDVCRSQLIGEVECHERLKRVVSRSCCDNSLAVCVHRFGAGDRGNQVGHDDGSLEDSTNIFNRLQKSALISQVNVPVIGASNREVIHRLIVAFGPVKLVSTAANVYHTAASKEVHLLCPR